MEFRQAEKHAKGCGDVGNPVDPKDIWGDEVLDVVKRRADEITRERQWVM
jgi:hypothetical protein